jgi:uncharacterized repeat protein (TIGR03803 family)
MLNITLATKRTANFAKVLCSVFMLCALTGPGSPAQTLTTLFSFDGTNGAAPIAGLVQATDGQLYGTTNGGGASATGGGTVFRITTSGTLATLHSFCVQSGCPDGYAPFGGLVQATNGVLYGTTNLGAPSGTVFTITPGGTFTTLYTFCSQQQCADGANPYNTLVQGTNRQLYGVTSNFGLCGYGTIFSITPAGVLTPLYSFCTPPDNYGPLNAAGALIQAANGNLYGTSSKGGNYGSGTVFKMTPTGTLTTLYSFCAQSGCPEGSNPEGGLVQASNGELYGITVAGGTNGLGTVFKMTPSGALTTIYDFCSQPGCPENQYSYFDNAGLIQATNGNFYGTTYQGGAYGGGTVFQITPRGTLTTLHSFCSRPSCADGQSPDAGLVQDTNGNLYGTTLAGGANRDGTVFKLSIGLGPFVTTLPTSGKIGSVVKILGTDLTGATSVTFNGTAAVFTVASSSLITTTVPAGTTSGTVQVVTPGGTLSSNVIFNVRP